MQRVRGNPSLRKALRRVPKRRPLLGQGAQLQNEQVRGKGVVWLMGEQRQRVYGWRQSWRSKTVATPLRDDFLPRCCCGPLSSRC